ncbi:hypothetical protein BC332_23514 [Capsicum chinense]|nr:hypothetical protein BC332_23514 [Capsicum chinense]
MINMDLSCLMPLESTTIRFGVFGELVMVFDYLDFGFEELEVVVDLVFSSLDYIVGSWGFVGMFGLMEDLVFGQEDWAFGHLDLVEYFGFQVVLFGLGSFGEIEDFSLEIYIRSCAEFSGMVELVKITGQKFSSAHVLEVYRGSLYQYVKNHRHEYLRLHGAGKQLAKGETSRVLCHLVTEDILMEDVKKSDLYGSVSSVLKILRICLLLVLHLGSSVGISRIFAFLSAFIRCDIQIKSAIELSTSDYDKEKLQERLAKNSRGVAEMHV